MMKKSMLALMTAMMIGSLSITATASFATDRRDEALAAREQMKRGKVKDLRSIEDSVRPLMRGMEYLGPEYDPYRQVYRLKFINGTRVIFVDVDATSGLILKKK